MQIGDTVNDLAYDSNALDKLKREAIAHPRTQAMAVARQVESLFMQMMLKSMRETLPEDPLFGSQQGKLFTSLYDQQISQLAGGRGLGMAEMIARQMVPAEKPDERTGTVPLPLGDERRAVLPQTTAIQQQIRAAVPDFSAPSAGVEEFLQRLRQPARQVSDLSGIPHHLILAQAALETGWGHRQILRNNGLPSFNVFGIKASSDWKGETTTVVTTEYQQGMAAKQLASFRVYHSYREALEDYARLLTSNPRYRQVTTAGSAESGAHALQAAGYATDPHYAGKLISVIRQLKQSSQQAVQNVTSDLRDLF
ncbi:flagellar assembly peptidoglycan hydrolase FlgJ [Tatumella citrea]|uniref:Peptidoglycan hydrolase FlgJ n=1 Tax=Tatumella citrea TaxID=53336 RepID=A0A1Y0LHU0_TATCI|nr:flagellar assembly peptidoglycan hydrolase FlgJ [Tatumella citrea]ARU93634.1 flagellar rod assembly protein/muramidase FlgJ [Tatumella citrea]ARU97672.1 flagellar rod assembly protein/muramidase FlgJ [Tatumella citrea]